MITVIHALGTNTPHARKCKHGHIVPANCYCTYCWAETRSGLTGLALDLADHPGRRT